MLNGQLKEMGKHHIKYTTDRELQFIDCTPQYEKYMISITSKDKLLEEINNEVQ